MTNTNRTPLNITEHIRDTFEELGFTEHRCPEGALLAYTRPGGVITVVLNAVSTEDRLRLEFTAGIGLSLDVDTATVPLPTGDPVGALRELRSFLPRFADSAYRQVIGQERAQMGAALHNNRALV